MSKFASKLTDRQFALARAIERAGLTSISQAVKAFERHDDAQIEEWKRQLNAKREAEQSAQEASNDFSI